MVKYTVETWYCLNILRVTNQPKIAPTSTFFNVRLKRKTFVSRRYFKSTEAWKCEKRLKNNKEWSQ